MEAMSAFEIKMTTNTIHCVLKKNSSPSKKKTGKPRHMNFTTPLGCFNREGAKSAKYF